MMIIIINLCEQKSQPSPDPQPGTPKAENIRGPVLREEPKPKNTVVAPNLPATCRQGQPAGSAGHATAPCTVCVFYVGAADGGRSCLLRAMPEGQTVR